MNADLLKKAKKDWSFFLIAYIKTDDIDKDIAEDINTRYDTSNYEFERTLPKGKNIIFFELMKDQLRGKMLIKFAGLREKTYSYLIDYGREDKKAKGAKTCVIKEKLINSRL